MNEINREDIGEIIRVACEMKHADEERLSVAELEAVAAELGLEPGLVARARAALEERARRREQQRARRRERTRRIAIAGVGTVVVVLLVLASLRGAAVSDHAEVDARFAQLTAVKERQREVQVRLASALGSPEKDAELAGAQNRVYIERKRYDEAATAWNQSAAQPVRALVIALFGLPARAPLSNELP